MDLSYQAIPHDSPSLERARHDAEFCCELEFWSSRLRHPPPWLRACAPNDPALQAVRLAREAERAHPGMASRTFDWRSRAYDAVHFLLSPQRRAGTDEEGDEDGWHDAIYGRHALNAEGRTTIGSPIRYTPPSLIREHIELLQIVTQDDLRQHFDAEKMGASVYKYFGQPEGFEVWMWPAFEDWRAFLVSMLDFPDEGLICCVG